MKLRLVAWLMALGSMLALAAVASASQSNTAGRLAFDGREILTFRATVAGFSPKQREGIIEERITNILSETEHPPLRAHDIRLVRLNNQVLITVRGHLLVTVSKLDARANSGTRQTVGLIWLRHFRTVLPGASPVPKKNAL
ncbi:MAG: hypothetical protein M1330_01550 [Armatimonadetes bacterium]|nr:hypothetical protein [Armatimonadota bacterium]